MTPTCTPVASCSARWHVRAAWTPSIRGLSPTATATNRAADELIPDPGGTSDSTCTDCGPTPSCSPMARTYSSPPSTSLSTDHSAAGIPVTWVPVNGRVEHHTAEIVDVLT